MNTKTKYLKQTIYAALISSTLVACSVENKDSADINVKPDATVGTPINEPPMITNLDDIVLPSTDYIEDKAATTPPVQSTLPKVKPALSKKQLFAGALAAHNRVRSKHGLQPLKWSDKLAKYSQEWANHLGKGQSCKMYHRSGSPKYGENLYRSTAKVWSEGNKVIRRDKNRVTIQNVVKAWTDEEQWYNYKNNNCQRGKQCGHYTQVVWRDTTEVGCAVKFCGDQSQNWVCSYNPPGNYTGQRPY